MSKRQRTEDYSVVGGYTLIHLMPILDKERNSYKEERIAQLDNYLKCFTEYFNLLESLLELDNTTETYLEKMLKDSIDFLNFIIAFIFYNLIIILDNKDYFDKFKLIFIKISDKLKKINHDWHFDGNKNYVELTKYNNTNGKEILEQARKKIYANFRAQRIEKTNTSFKQNITSQDMIKNTELVPMFDELQNYKPGLYPVVIVKGKGIELRKKKLETRKKFNFKKPRKYITQRFKPRSKFKESKIKKQKTKNKKKKKESKKNKQN
jgi:hypothetical protein